MSAWVCMPEHYGLLAAFAVRRNCVVGKYLDGEVAAASIADMLARQCIRSVACRYPNDPDGGRPGYSMPDAQIIAQAQAFALVYLRDFPTDQTDAHIHSEARCYSYHSCETDDWESTPAFFQAQKIIELTRNAPPLDDEVRAWGFYDERSRELGLVA